MKKLLVLGSVLCAVLFASCDTKTCKCYINDGIHAVYVEETYVNQDVACASLGYDNGKTYKVCLEYGEPDVNPGDVAQK